MNRREFAIGAAALAGVSQAAGAVMKANFPAEGLKKRLREGGTMAVAQVKLPAGREELEKYTQRGHVDLFYANCQHSPLAERELLEYCQAAESLGIGVELRMKHPRQAYMVGNLADLGPLMIKVPTIEEERHVQEAIDAFYFPPLGKRSWGGTVGFGVHGLIGQEGYGTGKERREYSQWWNKNCILCLQIESVRAVLNIRNLVKPGIDWLHMGPEDLRFDMEMHDHQPFADVKECEAYMKEQLKGSRWP